MSNNKYKILIVEDDRGIANFVQTVLDANGYQVLMADRCGQGILVFASHVPDLVILDLGLPDMDGEEFIRQIRSISAAPIVVLSARTFIIFKIFQTLDVHRHRLIESLA